MNYYSINITEDEAIFLFEYFNRFDDTEKLDFIHPAEYIALMKIASQIDKTTSAMFKSDYDIKLKEARENISKGYDGDIPFIQK